MLIDRGHLRWCIGSTLILVAGAVLYVLYAESAPGGPAGGSALGLTFGIIGTVFIVFAALLGVRKRRPHYRLGRASMWLKGHLWLGALAFPLILFHGGFEFGGPFTSVLMWTFVLVFATGIFGLALQQILPRFMTRTLPQETVYEQIDHVRGQLIEEAVEMARGEATRGAGVAKAKSVGKVQGRVVQSRSAVEASEDDGDRIVLQRFVDKYMRPFFEKEGVKGSPLCDPNGRAALFEDLRRSADPKLHGVIGDLAAHCEQRAELEAQRRLHHWLHGWLLIHVPLSWTMIFLTAVHAVMSLYY